MWFNASFFVYNLQAVLALVLAAAPAQLPAGLLAELTLEPLPHLGNDITTPYVAWDNVIIISVPQDLSFYCMHLRSVSNIACPFSLL